MTTVAQQSMRQSIALNNHKQRKSRHDDDDESKNRVGIIIGGVP